MAYWRLKRIIEKYRAIKGYSPKEIPEEVIELSRRIEEQKRKIAELEAKGASADLISIEVAKLGDLERAYRQLLKAYGLA